MDRKKLIIILSAVFVVVIIIGGLVTVIYVQDIQKKQNEDAKSILNENSTNIEDTFDGLEPEKDFEQNTEDLSFDQKQDLDSLDKAINELGQDTQNPDSDFAVPSDLGY